MSKTHDYGEPWSYFNDGNGSGDIESRAGMAISVIDDEVEIKRAIACVNTLAGIHDPAAALKVAREALEAEELWRNQPDDTGTLRAIAKEKRLKALNLLTPAP